MQAFVPGLRTAGGFPFVGRLLSKPGVDPFRSVATLDSERLRTYFDTASARASSDWEIVRPSDEGLARRAKLESRDRLLSDASRPVAQRHHHVVLLYGNLHHACVESGRVRLDVWVGPRRINPLYSDL